MDDYTIVFDKLAEMSAEISVHSTEATPIELDEIAELGRAVVEITQPPPMSFTTA
ncbi:MAG: hypothetical protein ACLQKA_16790 [Bryobacteraceae bacterium]